MLAELITVRDKSGIRQHKGSFLSFGARWRSSVPPTCSHHLPVT